MSYVDTQCPVLTASTEQVDKAKEIVKKLQFVFSSENFENPALQRYYANVEAMALDTDQPEEVEDYTGKSLDTGHIMYWTLSFMQRMTTHHLDG